MYQQITTFLEVVLYILAFVGPCFTQESPCPEEPLCPQQPLPPWPACPPKCFYRYETIDGVRCKTDCDLIPAMPGPPGSMCSPTGCPNEGIIEPWGRYSCMPDEFFCDDGSCIPGDKRCDDSIDCLNDGGSDERYC